jgi:hypothetical protein
MTIGFGEYNDDYGTYGFVARSTTNTNGFALGLTAGYTLKENTRSYLYNSNEISFGSGSYGEDRYNAQIQAASKLHYTTTANVNGVFLDANVGADVSFNNSYDQDVKYSIEVGPHLGATKDSNGYYHVSGKYGPYIENQSSERTNHNRTIDVGVGGGLAVGLAGMENQTYLFGNINQELTNKKNTSVTAGIGHAREVEIFGADCVVHGSAGYKFNLNGNSTNNLQKHSGAFVEAGVSIIF